MKGICIEAVVSYKLCFENDVKVIRNLNRNKFVVCVMLVLVNILLKIYTINIINSPKTICY